MFVFGQESRRYNSVDHCKNVMCDRQDGHDALEYNNINVKLVQKNALKF